MKRDSRLRLKSSNYPEKWNISQRHTYLGHYDDLLSREVVLLNRLPKDNFGQPVGVSVRGVECLDTPIVPANPNIK